MNLRNMYVYVCIKIVKKYSFYRILFEKYVCNLQEFVLNFKIYSQKFKLI